MVMCHARRFRNQTEPLPPGDAAARLLSYMDACCETKAEELNTLRDKHRKVLILVLTINAVLFIVEAIAGFLAHSTALLADSLDMFGDSLVYGFTLYVLWRSAESKAMAAMLKGAIMAVFGFGVLIEAVYTMLAGVVPVLRPWESSDCWS